MAQPDGHPETPPLYINPDNQATSVPPVKGVLWLDRSHEAVSYGVSIVSARIDRFFDTTDDEEVGDTRVKIKTGTELREGQGIRFKTGAGVRLDLPRLEKRLNILIENIDLSESTFSDQDVGDDFSAGLRLLLRQTRRTRLHADGGLRFSDGPILFGRLRLRRQYTWDPHGLRFTQFVQWYDREGFGETSRIEYEYALANDYLFQTRSDIDWSETTMGVEWTQQIMLVNVLRQRYGWSVFAETGGATRPNWKTNWYRSGVRYRRRMYREWLFLDLTPSVEFDRERDFDPELRLAIVLETIFGGFGRQSGL